MTPQDRSRGLPLALGAYVMWGFLPLYIALLRHVPAFELVAWRVIFTLPFCLAIASLRGQLGEIARAFGDLKLLRLLLMSAVLIALNWLIYIAAINGGHVFAASLGYYINPLLNVLLGTLFWVRSSAACNGWRLELPAAEWRSCSGARSIRWGSACRWH